MKAGRELDILIVEKVLGRRPCGEWFIQHHYPPVYMSDCDHNDCYPEEFGPCEYSANIGAAFQVLEKLNQDGIFVDIHQEVEDGKVVAWIVTRQGAWREEKLPGDLVKTLPLAICLFALEVIQ